LDEYIADVETPDENIIWTIIETPVNITVTIINRVVFITVVDENWNGSEIITFSARDEGGLEVTNQVAFTVTPVNDVPVITDIPNQTIEEGGSFIDINLDTYISDVETSDTNMVWSIEEASTNNINISITNRIATVTLSDVNWNGSETFIFRAEDEEGALVFDLVTFTVTPINDAPVIVNQLALSVAEESFISILLTDLIVEDFDDYYPTHFTLTVFEGLDYSILGNTVTPNENVVGTIIVPVTVIDPHGAESNRYDLQITVVNNNDPPILIDIPNQTIDEGGIFSEIDLNIYVSDADHADSMINWSAQGQRELVVNINNETNIATVSIPDINWFGQENIIFTASDGTLSNSDEVTLAVNPINDAPVIEGQFDISSDEDASFTIGFASLIVTDVDNQYPNEHSLHILSGNNYTVSNLTITPSENFNGHLIIPVYVADISSENSLSTTYNLSVNIGAVNDAPVINGQVRALNIIEDEPLVLSMNDIIVEDIDNNGNDLSLFIHEGNNYTVQSDTVLPSSNFYGTLLVDISVSDGQEENSISNRFTLNILVIAENDAPQAEDITFTVREDESYSLVMSDYVNDVDGNLDWTSLSILSQPLNGSVTVNASTGIILYEPEPSFSGPDSFSYEVCDFDQECSSATVQVTVSNEAPIANNDVVYLREDETEIFNVIQNDVDPQNNLDASSLTIISPAQHGEVTVLSNGELRYSPELNFYGIDECYYMVCDVDGYCSSAVVTFIIQQVNDMPGITGQRVISIPEDMTYTLTLNDLTVEDIDNVYPDDFALYVIPGANYSLSGNTVRPDRNFYGQLTVYLEVSDQEEANDRSEVFECTINVVPVNDPPVITNQISITTNEDIPVEIEVTDLQISDPDNVFPNDFVLVILPGLHYSVEGTTITSTPNYFGSLNIPIYVSDQEEANDRSGVFNLIVEVLPVNDAPLTYNLNQSTPENVALQFSMANMVTDVDGNVDYESFEYTSVPANGTLTVNNENRALTYQPNVGFSGEDNFNFRFYDTEGLVSNISTVAIRVNNAAPNAIDDAVVLNEDERANINVLENDTDPQNNIDASTILIITNPQFGLLEPNVNTGIIAYMPNANFYGSDQFTYRICDEDGYCDEASVHLQVLSVNDAPTAINDEGETYEDAPLVLNVLSNDTDIDSDKEGFIVSVYSYPSNGSVTVNTETMRLSYWPFENYFGNDYMEYEVCDDQGACSIGAILVSIIPVNDVPNAYDDIAETIQGQEVSVNVVVNDIDIDDNLDITSVTIVSQPVYGNASVETLTGSVNYTPDTEFYGEDSFRYQVCDTEGACQTAMVKVTVKGHNIPPECENDTIYMSDGELVSFSVLINDIDQNGDDIIVVIDEYHTLNGDLFEIENGSFSYQSVERLYCIKEVFSYQGCDASGICDQAEVVFIISPSDTDKDSIPDYFEQQYFDSDKDIIPDFEDVDSDNDGIPDVVESGISDLCNDLPVDTDEDGIPDYRDFDSDNDKVADIVEGVDDCDGDGILNYLDYLDECGELIYAPETFSPNGDGVNDYFIIPGLDDFDGNEIYIYNRWGGEVFYMKDYDNSWGGKSSVAIGADDLPQGTYFYVVKLTMSGKLTKTLTGTVFIKR
jgi:gliding motility-associated-like protein